VIRDRAPVVVGVDGSTATRSTLRWAADEARARGVALVAVHVWDDDRSGDGIARAARNESAVLDRVLAESADDLVGVEVVRVVRRGDPAAVLADEATNGALLVIGARRRSATGAVARSVAWRCVERAVGPVVLVPAESTPARRSAGGRPEAGAASAARRARRRWTPWRARGSNG
jgi:nucleotide-binding universal stress UspA family protein